MGGNFYPGLVLTSENGLLLSFLTTNQMSFYIFMEAAYACKGFGDYIIAVREDGVVVTNDVEAGVRIFVSFDCIKRKAEEIYLLQNY